MHREIGRPLLPDTIPTAAELPLDLFECGFLSSNQEAIRLLELYREKRMPQFPFVVLPADPDLSLIRLREESPLLFVAVIGSVLYDRPAQQQEIGEALRVQFMQRILLRSERSLDLLQALLVWLAWYHFFMPPKEQKLFVMTQLAIDQLYSLQLDKPVKDEAAAHSNVLSQSETRVVHNLAEKRTLLGVYWMSLK